jgi:hypothetical protein
MWMERGAKCRNGLPPLPKLLIVTSVPRNREGRGATSQEVGCPLFRVRHLSKRGTPLFDHMLKNLWTPHSIITNHSEFLPLVAT